MQIKFGKVFDWNFNVEIKIDSAVKVLEKWAWKILAFEPASKA